MKSNFNKLNKKILIKANIFALIIFCITFCFNFQEKNAKAGIETSSLVTESEVSNIDPEELYGKVWELIKKDYVDQTCNGQDWNIWKNRYKGKLKMA